jgi:lactate permease
VLWTYCFLPASSNSSIIVGSIATNWFGHEGSILRFVFLHSIALACLVGVLVMAQAHMLTGMVVR